MMNPQHLGAVRAHLLAAKRSLDMALHMIGTAGGQDDGFTAAHVIEARDMVIEAGCRCALLRAQRQRQELNIPPSALPLIPGDEQLQKSADHLDKFRTTEDQRAKDAILDQLILSRLQFQPGAL